MNRPRLPTSAQASGTVLVISPHLDDAVFACGRLLAQLSRFCRVLVATVFAGRPSPDVPHTEWDRAGGFAPSADVVGARREEDRQALIQLGATPVWLPFLDSQYGASPSVGRIASSLARQVRRWQPSLVLFPLGLFHSDHHLVRDAVLALMHRRSPRRHGVGSRTALWLAYEDALYRSIPGLRDGAVARLRRGGWTPRPFTYAGSTRCQQRKCAAVACYASQLRALATPGRLGHRDALAAEAYWRLGREGPVVIPVVRCVT
jgi:LmbE family N-acetylglucosaminyl deacetylase